MPMFVHTRANSFNSMPNKSMYFGIWGMKRVQEIIDFATAFALFSLTQQKLLFY